MKKKKEGASDPCGSKQEGGKVEQRGRRQSAECEHAYLASVRAGEVL